MNYNLSATARAGRIQDIRAAGRIPAVVYGKGIEPKLISLGNTDFIRTWRAAGTSSLIDVAIDNEAPVKALIKEVQRDVVKMNVIHVDLYQVRMDTEITATVKLVFVGESPAVKVQGGTLVTSLDEVEVECLPGDLPHEIEVDLSTLATFDDAITVETLVLPKGVKVTNDADITIATVAAPLTEEELKKMEESQAGDVTSIKSEADLKREAEEAKKAEEEAKK